MTTIASATAAPNSLSPFSVFRNRNFALMWIGQVIETIGCSLTSLAASILVFRLTGSAASVGLMMMATAAPTILVGLLAGVIVDRGDCRRIMIAADLLRAALVLLLPFLLPNSIAWLYVIVTITSAVTQFFDPAHESVLPEIATEEELGAADSLMAISSFGATAIGFAASGFIASSMAIEWAFYINAVAYVLSAVMVWAVRVNTQRKPADSGVAAIGRNLRAGAQVLAQTPMLRSLFLVFSLVFISFGLSNTLLLPFALKALGATEFQYGVQEALTSLAFVIGSLWMASMAHKLREGQWIALGLIGMALAGIGYASMPVVAPAILFVCISGFINAPTSIARRLVIQRYTPRDMRGRVNSAFFVCRDLLFLVGMAVAGLADVISIRLVYTGGALLLLAAGLWALFVPGLGQPAAEWKRALALLRAPAIGGLRGTRPATPADFDILVALLPSLGHLSHDERRAFISQAHVSEAAPGATVIRHGDRADEAYFVLSGQAVAGVATQDGGYRSLSALRPGDFFGEIAALTGAPRTANVVAGEVMTVLSVPASALRRAMAHPILRRLFASTVSERLSRSHGADWPRLAGLDQEALRELRNESGSSPLPEVSP